MQAEYDALRARHAPRSDRPMRHLRGGRARNRVRRSTGRATSRPVPAFRASHVLADFASARSPLHRLVAVLHGLGAEGEVPRDLRRPGRRRGRARAVRRRPAMLDRIVAEEWLTANARLRLLPGQLATATTSSSTPTSRARPSAPGSRPSASSGSARGSRSAPGRLRRPARVRAGRLPRRLRRDRRARRPELVAEFKARPRRLQRHHGQGPGRPPGRGVRREAAPAGPPRLGLRPRRAARATTT